MRDKIKNIAFLNDSNYKFLKNGEIIKYFDTSSVDKGIFLKYQELNTSIDKIPSRAKRAVKSGTTIISTVRPNLMHYGYFTNPEENIVVSTGFVTVDANETIIDKKYLYCVLTSSFVTNYLIKIASTSVSSYPSFNPDDLGELVIEFPESLEEQRRIANVIFSLKNKIELNNKICTELEALAKTLYDYWFVQFDFPDENGKPYKSSGGKMVYNEELKREIPEGWEAKPLKGIYNIERGLSYSSKDIESGTGIPMINLACIDRKRNYKDGELKYYSGKISESDFLESSDLMIACTDLTREREIIGCPFLVPDDGKKYTYSMDIAKLLIDEDVFNRMYIYMALRTDFYHNYIKMWASGTTVLHLNLEGLDWYNICIPPLDLQDEFSKFIENIHSKKSRILSENQQLSELRDFLLPMLVNGQVKINNIK